MFSLEWWNQIRSHLQNKLQLAKKKKSGCSISQKMCAARHPPLVRWSRFYLGMVDHFFFWSFRGIIIIYSQFEIEKWLLAEWLVIWSVCESVRFLRRATWIATKQTRTEKSAKKQSDGMIQRQSVCERHSKFWTNVWYDIARMWMRFYILRAHRKTKYSFLEKRHEHNAADQKKAKTKANWVIRWRWKIDEHSPSEMCV